MTVLVPNSTAANHLNDNFGKDLIFLCRKRAGAGAILQITAEFVGGKRAELRGSST